MRRLAKAPSAGSTLPSGIAARGIQIVALALALTFAFGVSQALAVDQTYLRIGSFSGGPGAGDEELNHPRRIAVDPSNGDLYVADRDNDRVVVYRPAAGLPPAAYLTQFGAGQLDEPFGVAVAANGDVYVSSAGNDRIVKFESDGATTPSFTVDPGFTSPALGVAADQIGDFEADVAVDPASGDLLVVDPAANLIKRFDSTGAHLANIDGSSSPQGAFQDLLDIDVAPDGSIYALDASGPLVIEGGAPPCTGNTYCATGNTVRVVRLDADGTNGANVLAPTTAETYGLLAYDPGSSQVLLANINPQRAVADAYRADGTGKVAMFDRLFGLQPFVGLAVGGPTSHAYLATDKIHHVLKDQDVGAVKLYADEPVNLPSAAAPTVSDVEDTSAHLSVQVNPNGEATEVVFEYTRFGSWTSLPAQPVGDGTSPATAEADLENLAPNASYRVRVRAFNGAGGTVTSAETPFSTVAPPPFAYSGGAAPRTETTARLNGWVNPRNNPTTYHFEYGPTSSYGTSLPATPESVGGGEAQLPVSAELTGLAPGATYHFRLVAENTVGTTFGEDRTFTTRTAAEAGPMPRGIELVNSPDKGNQLAQPPESGPLANRDATRILWTVTGGAPGASTGAGNTFMAQRTPQGWRSASLLPPADQLIDKGESRYIPMLANPSFDSFLFEISSGILARPPRKYASVDVSGHQEYKGELGVTDVPNVPVRGSDDFSRVYSTAFAADGTQQVFESTANPPKIVSILPDDEPAECGVSVSTSAAQFIGYGGNEWVTTDPDAPSRVYFEADDEEPCDGASKLFMRDVDAGTTTLISGPALAGGPQDERGGFARASADGSKVIFTADSRLTPDDTNDVGDIYRYEVGAGATCLTCVGRGADVMMGSVHDRAVIVSRDLSRIYFQSPNLLVPGVGEQGAYNLYEWHDGQIDYVGSSRPPAFGPEANFTQTSVAMAEGGRTIFFLSYDPDITTDDVGSTWQLFRYSEVDHSLECVSCKAGATQTAGVDTNVQNVGFVAGIDNVAENGDAAVFETSDPLVREDVNGDTDIYEWRNGKIGLVTDGVSQYPAGTGRLSLDGIGEDGMNVVFHAGVNLTGYERDHVGQMYVARVGGGFPPPPGTPAPCGEESCQGPLQAPPPLSSPGSATIAGLGNATAEESKPVKRCRAKPRKPHKSRKAGKGRRAGKGRKAGKGRAKASRAQRCAKKRVHKKRSQKKGKAKKKSANRKQGRNR